MYEKERRQDNQVLIKRTCKILCQIQLRRPYVCVLTTMEAESTIPAIETPGPQYTEVLRGKYSGGHESSIMASENRFGELEREVVGESRSLLRDKVGMRLAVTGRGWWQLDELGSVHEGGATQVVKFPPSTERQVCVVLDSGIPDGMKAYSLSSPFRAPSR